MSDRIIRFDAISIWDLPGSDVLGDLDFSLTYGDGVTLHTLDAVIEEVSSQKEWVGADLASRSPHTGLCEALTELEDALLDIQADRGGDFFISF